METILVLISPGAFSMLIMLALIITSLTPIIMLGLMLRDKRNKTLW